MKEEPDEALCPLALSSALWASSSHVFYRSEGPSTARQLMTMPLDTDTGKQGASSPPPTSVGSKLKSRLSFLFARSPQQQQQQHQQQQAGAANVERGKNNSGKNKTRDEAKQDEPDTSEGNTIDYRPSARALQPAKANLRRHYPKIEPFETGFLDVDHHSIYWEQSGKRDGYPVAFSHGGPVGAAPPMIVVGSTLPTTASFSLTSVAPAAPRPTRIWKEHDVGPRRRH
ncbi:hypothetical protein L7F22_000293 [Adiantum nelumboides]|nr:hypothetical protein [Adiantum nelumboides]